MHRLLLDEGLPFRAAAILRSRGVDAVHTEDLQLTSAPDHEIVERARREGRSCVTLDRDFHRILAESNTTSPSVILLRYQFLNAQRAADLILTVLNQVGGDLEVGIAVTATLRGIRVRRLPLKS